MKMNTSQEHYRKVAKLSHHAMAVSISLIKSNFSHWNRVMAGGEKCNAASKFTKHTKVVFHESWFKAEELFKLKYVFTTRFYIRCKLHVEFLDDFIINPTFKTI